MREPQRVLQNVCGTRGVHTGKSVAIHFLYYNFARMHKTLRVTPAMAAGLSDHVWSLEAAPITIPDQFIHRYLEPYYESFCRVCARQVGMAKEESGLIRDEKNHICDPYLVEM